MTIERVEERRGEAEVGWVKKKERRVEGGKEGRIEKVESKGKGWENRERWGKKHNKATTWSVRLRWSVHKAVGQQHPWQPEARERQADENRTHLC